jgi:hypothetical protein
MKTTNDPENYRKNSVPFDGPDAANDAVKAFYTEVEAARNRHRIADVAVAIALNVKYENGEGIAMTHAAFGDCFKTESLLAYALGVEQADGRQRLATLLKGKRAGMARMDL